MTDWQQGLMDKIDRRDARVAIVGLGYVGLPLALAAVDEGFHVTGIEVDGPRRAALLNLDASIEDIGSHDLRRATETGRWKISGDFASVRDSQIVVICVPTPLVAGVPDLSSVLSSTDEIAKHITRGTLVSLESTTYPGTTEEVLRPRLHASGLQVGVDLALVFSPERIDPGNDRFGLRDIPKLVAGVTEACGRVGTAFYSTLVTKVITLARPREAEMAKLLENTYRQVNIALINEFAMVAHELGIDIWDVVGAAATKPFGFQSFYPGIGIGGHCIAVDPVYLTWRIRELGRAPFRMVELAQEVDESMPTYVATRICEVLSQSGIPVRGARVFALGITYKPDVADLRTSRALDVLAKLQGEGCSLSYHDPFHDSIDVEGTTLHVAELATGLAECDIVAILTHHSSYNWGEIVAHAPRVFDARGVTRGIEDAKVERL